MAQGTYKPTLKYHYTDSDYLNYEKIGNGTETLIFLHGFGASLHSWDDIKDLFPQEKYTLYLIDLKGFGYSSKPHDNQYQILDHSRILIKMLEDLSLSNVVFIGHSYGGAVTLLSVLELMKLGKDSIVKKLILIDAAAFPEKIPFFVQFLRNPFIRFFTLHVAPPKYRAVFTLEKLFYDKQKVDANKINRYAHFFKQKSFDYTIVQMAEQIIPDNYQDYVDSYKKISKPSLILWGKNDPIFPLHTAQKLQSLIRGSVLHVIDKCGHIPQEECPDQTYELILNFLND